MTIRPPPLLPPSCPRRLTFHLKGRMGKRQARRTWFISENHWRLSKQPKVELDLKKTKQKSQNDICSFVCVCVPFHPSKWWIYSQYNEKGITEKGTAAGRKHAQLHYSTIVPLLVTIVVVNHSLFVWWHQRFFFLFFFITPSVFTSTRIPFSVCCTFYDDNGTLVPHPLGPNVPKIGHKYCCAFFLFSFFPHEHLKKKWKYL